MNKNNFGKAKIVAIMVQDELDAPLNHLTMLKFLLPREKDDISDVLIASMKKEILDIKQELIQIQDICDREIYGD